MLIHKDGIKWLQNETDKFQMLLQQYRVYEALNNQGNWSAETQNFVSNFQSSLNKYATENIIGSGLLPKNTYQKNNSNFFTLLNDFTAQVCNHITHEEHFRNFMKPFSTHHESDSSEIKSSKSQVRNEMNELNSNFFALYSCMQDIIAMNKTMNRAVNLSKDYQDIEKFSKHIGDMKRLINNIETSSNVIGTEINNMSKLKPVDRNIVPKPELPDYRSSWVYPNILSWI